MEDQGTVMILNRDSHCHNLLSSEEAAKGMVDILNFKDLGVLI